MRDVDGAAAAVSRHAWGVAMYQHILLPTDGSEISEKAIKQCIEFAKILGARVTGFFASPAFHLTVYDDWIVEPMSQSDFEDKAKKQSEQRLASIGDAANAAAVPCELVSSVSDSPHAAIIKAAQERHCDLIFMASHGRRGITGLLLGSETMKVLTHSTIPVLVYR